MWQRVKSGFQDGLDVPVITSIFIMLPGGTVKLGKKEKSSGEDRQEKNRVLEVLYLTKIPLRQWEI